MHPLALFFTKSYESFSFPSIKPKVVITVAGFIGLVTFTTYLIFKALSRKTDGSRCLSNKKIYLFRGNPEFYGICMESLKSVRDILCTRYTNYTFKNVDGEYTNISEWDFDGLLIFPGGRTSDWEKMLSPPKQKEILSWINRGGRIYAECAGSYFCSTTSDYRFSADQRKVKTRELSLYQGICRGPLYSIAATIGKIRWERTKKEGYVVIIGAGEFLPTFESHQEVLATFTDSPKGEAFAVVKCTYGKGMAILSTPHWGLGSDHLEALQKVDPSRFQEIESMKQKLDSSRQFREECMSEMFETCLHAKKFAAKEA